MMTVFKRSDTCQSDRVLQTEHKKCFLSLWFAKMAIATCRVAALELSDVETSKSLLQHPMNNA